jgi:LacI family gluconate utilization system Gnt-I transcriptional repressor
MSARPRKPTMQDVSRLAGVSTMTVSRVLAEPGVVAPETRERVRHAIEQLGYVPDKVAGSLSSRRTGFIAAILPTLTNANFADTARGLTEALRRAGYQLLIGYTMYSLAEEERLIRAMLARRPEAIVVTGATHSRAASRLLLGAGVPIIEIWELPARPLDHAVGFSNREVGRAAARHLLELGHRRLGALGPRPDGEARDFRGEERLAGFATVLREHGLDDNLLVREERVPLSFEQGARSLAALLERAPDVEAVFAVSDLAAVGALMECHRREIHVPRDLSLIGFGDFEIGRQCVPALTTIRVDARDIGRRTGELLLRLLGIARSAGAGVPDLVDVGFQLIPRETTAPAARSRRTSARRRVTAS